MIGKHELKYVLLRPRHLSRGYVFRSWALVKGVSSIGVDDSGLRLGTHFRIKNTAETTRLARSFAWGRRPAVPGIRSRTQRLCTKIDLCLFNEESGQRVDIISQAPAELAYSVRSRFFFSFPSFSTYLYPSKAGFRKKNPPFSPPSLNQ